jgi:polyhydroxyalkanoate synthesis repressor PhaR
MGSASPETITIKRYPNRRLYDRQSRRYITLQDLEEMVTNGKKIEVRDSRSGEDLTRAILTQILLERHPEKMEMFPVAMLHGILQANDLVLEFLRSYLRQSLAILEQLQQPAAPLAPFLTPIDWMRAMIPATLPFSSGRPAEPSQPASLEETLAARISDLEDRLAHLEKPSVAKPRPGTAAVVSSASSARPHARSVNAGQAAVDELEERLSELEEETQNARDGPR